VEISDFIGILAEQGRLMAAAARAAGPDAAVPTCPEWVVRDLVRHQGGVHRWATSIVGSPRTEPWDVDLPDVVGDWPPDDQLVEWFADGVSDLVSTFRAADPGLDCWTFLAAPSPLAMWSRRQAHETSIHRVDAELAAGWPVTAFPVPFAADGIDELLAAFITRPHGRLQSDPPATLRVRCTDTPAEWLVRIGPDGVTTEASARRRDSDSGSGNGVGSRSDGDASPAADCTIAGPAGDLYLALWNRKQSAGLAVEGDRSILDLFLDRVHIRWS
jgi:uncharacterized protein (TIGR03083 family)